MANVVVLSFSLSHRRLPVNALHSGFVGLSPICPSALFLSSGNSTLQLIGGDMG